MAKRHGFGPELSEEDKKRKIDKEGLKQVRKMFVFLKPYQSTFVWGMIFLFLSSATMLSFPKLMGEVTSVIEGKSAYTLNQVIGLLAIVLVLQGIFSFFRIYTFNIISENVTADIRRKLYSKIISLPISFFEKHRVGDITSRIGSDVSRLEHILSITLAEFFRQILTLLVGIGFLLFTSWKLTLFMLAIFPVLIIASIFFGRYTREMARKVQDMLAKSNVIVEETMQSVQVVKAFTNEKLEINRYDTALKDLVKTAIKASTVRGSFVSFIIVALFGAIISVVWYGAGLVQSKEINFSDLLTFIFYTMFIGGAVGGMGELYGQVNSAIGASTRVLEILEEDSEVSLDDKKPIKKLKGKIVFDEVAFSYPSRADVEVLKNISMSIDAGEKIALVGQSGAGKSTIAQLLMRFYKLTGGEIRIDDVPIEQYDISQLRQNIAIVPQEVMLFGGTIYENILYGNPEANEEEVMEAAKKANAWQFIQHFPEKFQTIVGERGIKLSGGQRQRIAIARAILKNPAILILDEATSSLDAESEYLVQEALDVLMQNRTTIIIAHRLATIRNADTICVLRDGEIVEKGSHQDLISLKDGMYANLIRLQFDTEFVS